MLAPAIARPPKDVSQVTAWNSMPTLTLQNVSWLAPQGPIRWRVREEERE
jgi:hypothetical protein